MAAFRLTAGVVVVLAITVQLVAAAHRVHGVVRDPAGAAVPDAEIVVETPEGTPVASVRTGPEGAFSLDVPSPGRYLLTVTVSGFREHRRILNVEASRETPALEIALDLAGMAEDVTVTATRADVQDVRSAGQPVNIITSADLQTRVRTVLAEAMEGETGIQVQRTSPTVAGVFVRGLTGNKVNVFLDGIRYSNGAQRGGVNTFLDLIEPDTLESVEVLRGPSSAQYGSDALGGSVQFLTRLPALAAEGHPAWRGSFALSGGTAHTQGGGEWFLAYAGETLGVTMSFAGRKAGRLRPGHGVDSHSVVTRYFGLPSTKLMDRRLPDTGFHQAGGAARAHWAPSAATRIVLGYSRTYQNGGRRYDQLLGGDGNLIAALNGLSLDFASVRVERLGGRIFDYSSLTYSLNSQREERVNQGGAGNPAAIVGHEPERTTANGMQAVVTKQLSRRHSVTAGADVYFEGLTSKAFDVDPITGAVSPRRPRVPNGATYRHGGVFVQTTLDAVPDRLRLLGAFRWGGAAYRASAAGSPLVNGQPLWPDDSLRAGAATFRAGVVASPDEAWTIAGTISRGFRAPHMTDLGTLGLTGSGFEVAAPDVDGSDAAIGSTADASAVSTGRAVTQVKPETSLQYETSLGYRRPRWRLDVTWFVNTIDGNIQKQALILPAGAVGHQLGGQPIVSQNANGVVFVAATSTPVLVRANFDRARIWGIEHTGSVLVGEPVTVQAAFTYLRARDTATGLPPNIEGGTPAPEAHVSVRWQRPRSRWWVEPYLHAAWRQSHLSSLDLGDRRTGASRSRASIRAFFFNGARARGWTDPGADGTFGTADDLLLATGETLAQVQDRVLGAGVNAAPLLTAVPGYVVAGCRAGITHGRHQVIFHAENLTDANYRGISWGVDAPGRGISARYVVRF